MNTRQYLWSIAGAQGRALPILSFPAAQKMQVTVQELVRSADLQARAMETITRETDAPAALGLMDLSVEAEAFGAQVRFFEDEVPAVTGQLVADLDGVEALAVPSPDQGRAAICVDAIRRAGALIQDRPVLAGMIGPFSLAGRLMDVTEIMYLCYDEPEAVHAMLQKATQFLIAYGRAFKDAGANGLMMAEPLAGILSPSMAAEFSVPYVRRIIEALQEDAFAVIYHNCGSAVMQMLDEIYSQGAAAYHFGNAVDLPAVLAKTPGDILVMGNIDPSSRFVQGTPDEMRAAVNDLAQRCAPYPNFLLSSGCDIPAAASWENIRAFFGALKAE